MQFLETTETLKKIVNECFKCYPSLISQLNSTSTQSAEALLEQLKAVAVHRVARDTDHHYLCISHIQDAQFSYIFSPIILSVLKYKTVFVSPKTEVLLQVLAEYFRIDALNLQHAQALEEMELCFDLQPKEINIKDLQVYTVFKALMDQNSQSIIVLGESLDPELTVLCSALGLKIIYPMTMVQVIDLDGIELKKLFWKRKTDTIAATCQAITCANSALVQQMNTMNEFDAERLIDDLMYSEHLFEKISVFGEFTETIYKHHHR